MKNDEIIKALDEIMGEYLNLLPQQSPLAKKCAQNYCLGVLNAVKAGLVGPVPGSIQVIKGDK